MKNVILASLPLVAAMVACSSPPTDGSETVSNEQALSSWKPVLRCDGNTVVDVNVGERRNLQLVIRDRAVIDRLLSVGYMQHFVGTSYDDREIVIRGYVGSLGERQRWPSPRETRRQDRQWRLSPLGLQWIHGDAVRFELLHRQRRRREPDHAQPRRQRARRVVSKDRVEVCKGGAGVPGRRLPLHEHVHRMV